MTAAPPIVIEPLTAERFASFGAIVGPQAMPGRSYFDAGLGDDRAAARPSLSLVRIEHAVQLPVEVTRMERHRWSSQSFVPLSAIPFLVIVAPHGPEGRPDIAAARAFRAEAGQGITYFRDVWHHPMAVLQEPAGFAILMWRDQTSADEEFVDVLPFLVQER
jgi:ureidoglycolate lyase